MLCQFARQFPPLVAEFLERCRQFKRRLREETVTDLMMVNLQNLGSDQIIVDFPDEPTTGADMEWNFVNRSNHTFYRLLLQAKCALRQRRVAFATYIQISVAPHWGEISS
jgi:hypothetical protein